MEIAIQACRKHGKFVGICGQAPSDFPEITRWLVEQEINSISLNPDSVLKMTQIVLDIEAEQRQEAATMSERVPPPPVRQAAQAGGAPGVETEASLLD